MPRTTQDLVGTIIEIDAGDDLTAFVGTASMMVDSECTASGYSNDRLELIERYLSAHLYCFLKPRVAQEGIATGPHEMFEFVKNDLGLRLTKYGQTALDLDPEGNLAALENSLRKVVRPMNPAGGVGLIGTSWLGSEDTLT